MILNEHQLKTASSNCLIDAKRKKRKCIVEGCDEIAINSHVLWKGGILKPISNSHLIELNTQKSIRDEDLKFTATGLKDILSFYGFCNIHDQGIFRQIEQNGVDYNKLNNQILVSVRGVFYEMYKKQIEINWSRCLLRKNIFPLEDQILYLNINIESHQLGLKDLSFFSSELNKEFRDPKGRFVFKVFKLRETPVVASSLFNVESVLSRVNRRIIDDGYGNHPINTILFNFFPFEGESILLIGYHVHYLENSIITNRISNFSEYQMFKFISDVLLERIESWACSFSFYENYMQKFEDKILLAFNEESKDSDGIPSSKINIFEEWLT